MKIMILVLLLSPFYGSSQTQTTHIVPLDSTVSFFELLWKFEDKYFITEYADGNYFYKAVALPLSEAQSNLEGEILYEVFFLKGEYGEAADGKLVKIGKFYKISNLAIVCKKNKALLKVTYGSKEDVGVYLIE